MSDELLYTLLPAIYRARDARTGEPLRALLGVYEGLYDALGADIEQLYDDFFVETCRPERLPRIGDLVGTGLPDGAPEPPTMRRYVANDRRYRRRAGQVAVVRDVAADVTGWPCHVVEGAQRLVVSVDVRRAALADERPGVDLGRSEDAPDPAPLAPVRGSVSVRRPEALAWIGTPFDPIGRSVDLRRHATPMPRRPVGHHTLDRLELYLFRLAAWPIERSAPGSADLVPGGACYVIDPLGERRPLFGFGASPDADDAPLDPLSVPMALDRATLAEALAQAGDDPERAPVRVFLEYTPRAEADTGQVELLPSQLTVAALDPWPEAVPDGQIAAIDPESGRVMVAPAESLGWYRSISLSYALGFPAAIGGGAYRNPEPVTKRADGVVFFDTWLVGQWPYGAALAPTNPDAITAAVRARYGYPDTGSAQTRPDGEPSVMPIAPELITPTEPLRFAQLADVFPWLDRIARFDRQLIAGSDAERDAFAAEKLRRLRQSGVRIELFDSGRASIATRQVQLAGRPIALAARPGTRPAMVGALDLQAVSQTIFEIEGLLWRGALRAMGDIRLTVRDCTLRPEATTLPAPLVLDGSFSRAIDPRARLVLERSIVPRVRVTRARGELSARDSVIDGEQPAADTRQPASAPDWTAPTPEIRIGLGEPGIAYADVIDEQGPGGPVVMAGVTVFGRTHTERVDALDTLFDAPVRAADVDRGRLDHCYLPAGSRTPPRARCADADAGTPPPLFVSRDPIDPCYALLDGRTDPAILTGGARDGEIGVYAHLGVPRRLGQLRAALERFLPLTVDTEVILVTDGARAATASDPDATPGSPS